MDFMDEMDCMDKNGQIAKLEPISKKPLRRFGVLKGKIKIAIDFDVPFSDDFLTKCGREIKDPDYKMN